MAPAPAIAIETEIAQLRDLDLGALRRRWRGLFGRPAPEHLTRALLERVIAYRIQAQTLGDLDRATARVLDELARSGSQKRPLPLPALRPAKPGTLLVREWKGMLQRVVVLEEGFAWNGITYASLSEAARAITGTNWNGPRFFGLRDGRAAGRPSAAGRARP